MWNKRCIIGCLTTFACITLANGPAYGQTWTGNDISGDCEWGTKGNWDPEEDLQTCDDLTITDSVPCAVTIVNGVPNLVQGNYRPRNVHIGHGMTMKMGGLHGIFIRGMLYIIGTVIINGEGGFHTSTLGLRLGELDSSTGTLLTYSSENTDFRAGDIDGGCCGC